MYWPIAIVRLFIAIAPVVAMAGCSDKSPPAKDSGETHREAQAGRHAHTAPHGGALIELGDHAASLELVFDSASGTLDLYVLDAHAENYVRITAPSIPASATAEGTSGPIALELLPVASPLSGEIAGDTARFSAQMLQLQGRLELDVIIPQIDVAGVKYVDITAQVHSLPE